MFQLRKRLEDYGRENRFNLLNVLRFPRTCLRMGGRRHGPLSRPISAKMRWSLEVTHTGSRVHGAGENNNRSEARVATFPIPPRDRQGGIPKAERDLTRWGGRKVLNPPMEGGAELGVQSAANLVGAAAERPGVSSAHLAEDLITDVDELAIEGHSLLRDEARRVAH